MSEWQPIETAPKDCAPVLLWEPFNDVTIGECVSGKWYGRYDASGMVEVLHPTVWMPLPEPPK